ncbi:MAG: DUF3048 domain-containing protein [Nocardioidaceae bacterium]
MIGSPMRSRRSSRAFRTRSLVALALTASVAVAGCSKGSSGSSSGNGTPAGQSTAAGSTMMGQWPFTGLPAHGAAPKHPPIIVKIDNSANSRPQVGLRKADLITEELVEGGITRLAVFFYSHLPKVVGPVRSMRASDIGIVKPAHGVLVASGGAPPTVRRINAAHIKAYTEGAKGYYRTSRVAPYNLFMRLPELAGTLKAKGNPPDYLPWGSASAFPKGQKAKGLSATFSAGHTTVWSYQGGKYVNTNTNAAAGDLFKPTNVVVLRVKVGDAGYLDPAGNPVPETHFTGKGQAMVFHGGRMVRATWVKKGYNATVGLRTKSGSLGLPPGHTWVELVPAATGSVSVTK